MDWIRPEFGALLGPTKSIRAAENLFARDSALLRFASFARVERRCSATSEIRPKLPVQIRAPVWCRWPEFFARPFSSTAPWRPERIVDFEIDEIIDNAHGFPLHARFRQFSRFNPKP
jgi:hypothetical protein